MLAEFHPDLPPHRRLGLGIARQAPAIEQVFVDDRRATVIGPEQPPRDQPIPEESEPGGTDGDEDVLRLAVQDRLTVRGGYLARRRRRARAPRVSRWRWGSAGCGAWRGPCQVRTSALRIRARLASLIDPFGLATIGGHVLGRLLELRVHGDLAEPIVPVEQVDDRPVHAPPDGQAQDQARRCRPRRRSASAPRGPSAAGSPRRPGPTGRPPSACRRSAHARS